MTPPKNHWPKVAIALFVAICGYGGYRYFADRHEAKALASGVSVAESAKTGKEDAGKETAKMAMGSSRPKPGPAPVKQAHLAASAASFYRAANLRELLDGLRGDPSKKNDYDLVMAKAAGECFMFSIAPGYVDSMAAFMRSLNKFPADLMDHYATMVTERCRDFASSSGPITRKDIHALYETAAKEGSVEAQAWQLMEKPSEYIYDPALDKTVYNSSIISIDDLRSQAIDLINSGDPQVIFWLGDMFGVNSKLSGPAAGTTEAWLAWRLVACDMGLDCSANSVLLANLCFYYGGFCAAGDFRSNIQWAAQQSAQQEAQQAGAAVVDYQKIVDLEYLILTQIRNGNTAAFFQ